MRQPAITTTASATARSADATRNCARDDRASTAPAPLPERSTTTVTFYPRTQEGTTSEEPNGRDITRLNSRSPEDSAMTAG